MRCVVTQGKSDEAGVSASSLGPDGRHIAAMTKRLGLRVVKVRAVDAGDRTIAEAKEKLIPSCPENSSSKRPSCKARVNAVGTGQRVNQRSCCEAVELEMLGAVAVADDMVICGFYVATHLGGGKRDSRFTVDQGRAAEQEASGVGRKAPGATSAWY